jgi:hypothetical protein
MVLCTFGQQDNYISENSLVHRTFLIFLMQQSCKIFVEMYLKNKSSGAEHRNI